MELDLLTAISPIDGRYRGKAGALASYFSVGQICDAYFYFGFFSFILYLGFDGAYFV